MLSSVDYSIANEHLSVLQTCVDVYTPVIMGLKYIPSVEFCPLSVQSNSVRFFAHYYCTCRLLSSESCN